MNNTYIHETHTIYSENGEVHLVNDNNTVVFNARNLLQDLNTILYYAIKEVDKENKELKNRLRETLETIK